VKTNKQFACVLLLFVGFYSCTEDSETPCDLQDTMFVSSTASHPCSGSGTIQITGPVGDNFQYKIDNQPFQNLPTFLNVNVGKHILVVKDDNGCQINKEVIIEPIPKGNTFNQVSQILANRCSSCHSGNNPQAGLNLTKPCDILNHWDRIQARAVNGIPSPMPQAGLIPLEERNKIMEWIANGHTYED
jgi:hypothetical protein